jgi:putative phosphoribosyl transferase
MAVQLRLLSSSVPLFEDRGHAGRLLAAEVERAGIENPVVVGLARGGVAVAAEVAAHLGAPIDVLAVRKVGHPWQPEYALGAATPGGGVYVRSMEGLTSEELDRVVADAGRRADELDRRLHYKHPRVDLRGRSAVLVDDGLATGATMIAAARWAHAREASRVVVAVPVGAAETIAALRNEVDEIICPYELEDFVAVGVWYRNFEQVEDADVLRLLEGAPS